MSKRNPRATSTVALLCVLLGAVGAVACALFAWGGLFSRSYLPFVFAGIAVWAGIGLIATWRLRRVGSLAAAWTLALLALFAPLLGFIASQGGGPALTSNLMIGAIGLWWSGVAAVCLLVGVLVTIVQSRAVRRGELVEGRGDDGEAPAQFAPAAAPITESLAPAEPAASPLVEHSPYAAPAGGAEEVTEILPRTGAADSTEVLPRVDASESPRSLDETQRLSREDETRGL